ncbi:MAG: hypothetical protein AAF960_10265 [Bacteroidota bacterium]
MVNPFLGVGLLYFIVYLTKKKGKYRLLLVEGLLLVTLTALSAQNCDYLPGNVLLNASPDTNSSFYTTAYFIVNNANDSIVQVAAQPDFLNVRRGNYAAYAVTYKLRDSIFNLSTGQIVDSIRSLCLDFSNPYVFNVCSPPQLSNLEVVALEVCADGSKISLTDSLHFVDNDGLLDTFSIIATITESPAPIMDTLDVDISIFYGLSKTFITPTLTIRNIRSPMQVQAILRAIHFRTNGAQGSRKISFRVFDGLVESASLSREITVTALPSQPIRIFRKRGEEE